MKKMKPFLIFSLKVMSFATIVCLFFFGLALVVLNAMEVHINYTMFVITVGIMIITQSIVHSIVQYKRYAKTTIKIKANGIENHEKVLDILRPLKLKPIKTAKDFIVAKPNLNDRIVAHKIEIRLSHDAVEITGSTIHVDKIKFIVYEMIA